MLAGEIVITQRLRCPIFYDLGSIGEFQLFKFYHYGGYFIFGGLAILLGMDGLKHGGDLFYFSFGNCREYIAVKMNYAPLPFCIGIKIGQRLNKTQAFIAYE